MDIIDLDNVPDNKPSYKYPRMISKKCKTCGKDTFLVSRIYDVYENINIWVLCSNCKPHSVWRSSVAEAWGDFNSPTIGYMYGYC